MPRTPETTALAHALGDAGRAAVGISEDLLDGLAVLGDRATQDAVDALVDDAAGLLREIAATTHELTLGIAGTGTGTVETGRRAAADLEAPSGSEMPR